MTTVAYCDIFTLVRMSQMWSNSNIFKLCPSMTLRKSPVLSSSQGRQVRSVKPKLEYLLNKNKLVCSSSAANMKYNEIYEYTATNRQSANDGKR